MRVKPHIFLFIVFFSRLTSSSAQETLPTWHWSYRFIDELQVQGCFKPLLEMNRPYTRMSIAQALVSSRDDIESDRIQLTSSGFYLFGRLEDEFSNEIRRIHGEGEKEDQILTGLNLRGNVDRPEGGDAEFMGVYRSKLRVSLGKYVTIYNGISFNQYLAEDSTYIGKKWRGIAGYTEQAYATFNKGRFLFTFGRDFLRWGPGQSGTLFFSDVARPLDQVKASVKMGPFQYTFVASVLDDRDLSSADSMGIGTARRYVSAHRLDGMFFKGKLQCAVTEAVVYGGVGRMLDWVYLNPFIFYHGVQMNQNLYANTLGTVDILAYPFPRWKVYGSMLIDDIQIEKTGPGDLEPNEIGWLIGSMWADPFRIPGMTVTGEYVRVANRTYKTPKSWEAFIHRNQPLGHPLGNDFDLFNFSLSKWMFKNVWVKAGFTSIRKGEGSLFTEWDTPWMAYTVEEGYSEPFPTGIVEHRKQLDLSLRFYPSVHWGLEADVQLYSLTNAGHVEGEKRNEAVWRVGFWWDGEVKIKL